MDVIRQIKRAYRAHADPELAVGMRAYMRDQFPFLGIQRKARDEIAADARNRVFTAGNTIARSSQPGRALALEKGQWIAVNGNAPDWLKSFQQAHAPEKWRGAEWVA